MNGSHGLTMIIFGSLDGALSKKITRIEEGVLPRDIMSKATLHLLQTCPFSWKVRGVIEHLGMDVQEIQVNAMKTKKELAFTDGWNKVPVFTDSEGTIVVDSTPIMSYIDDKYNQSKLSNAKGTERYDNMLEHVDNALSLIHI